MERHSCRKLDVPVMVVAPPTHIENHLLGYRPMLGFDGADVLADQVYTTATLGLEKHLIDMFGDAGLDYEGDGRQELGVGGAVPDHGISEEIAATNDEIPQLPPPTSQLPSWTDEAQAMLKKVPFFVRGRVQKNVEKYAVEHQHGTITVDVLQAAREALGG
jgi:light-independent protochlorophyllide reductase subunit B